MEIAVGAVIDDRYEVLGRIGSGAVAVVYLVRHVQLGSLHALKVLLIPTRFVQQRLLQEGRLQGAVRDRNVVPVTDVVDVDGAPGLVMEYVRGPSLERLLQHAHFDTAQAVALGAGMILGVRSAHDSGLVHRDLKPANVLIDVDDHELVPKIADFGLAKILHGEGDGPTATRTGSTLGTPAYMAPEQIRDARAVDERADVFSLGAVLYEVLTSRRAFPGDDVLELYDRIRDGRYAPVRTLVPEVPAALERVVADALEVDRSRRIASVAELLDRWTEGRGEAAAEFDWPSGLVTLVEGLAPSSSTLTPSGTSAQTFDLPPPALTDEASVDPGPLPPAVVVAETTVAEPVPAPPPRPALPQVEAVAQLRPVYTAADAPRVSADPVVEASHRDGWAALRDGRPADAIGPLKAVVVSERPDSAGSNRDLSVRLLLATAQLWLGDPEGYRGLEDAARIAGTRRGPIADLGRLAGESVSATVDPKAVDEHLRIWPDDLLARLLLATVDGLDADRRIELARQAVALDPESAGGRTVLGQLLLDRGLLDEAEDAVATGLATSPNHPGLLAVRARGALQAGRLADARKVAEEVVGLPAAPPEAVEVLAAALRTANDQAGLDGLEAQVHADAAAIGFARGRAEAAFGLGRIDEAFQWIGTAFDRASAAGRLDDSAQLARFVQSAAVVVGRRTDLEFAVHRAEGVTALVGLPRVLHDRLTPRILLLNGLLALDAGDTERVERTIQQLEAAERGERQAALLRAASLSAQDL
ncbi:MAG: protein kinase, partial [Myxococcota bacterium]